MLNNCKSDSWFTIIKGLAKYHNLNNSDDMGTINVTFPLYLKNTSTNDHQCKR